MDNSRERIDQAIAAWMKDGPVTWREPDGLPTHSGLTFPVSLPTHPFWFIRAWNGVPTSSDTDVYLAFPMSRTPDKLVRSLLALMYVFYESSRRHGLIIQYHTLLMLQRAESLSYRAIQFTVQLEEEVNG